VSPHPPSPSEKAIVQQVCYRDMAVSNTLCHPEGTLSISMHGLCVVLEGRHTENKAKRLGTLAVGLLVPFPTAAFCVAGAHCTPFITHTHTQMPHHCHAHCTPFITHTHTQMPHHCQCVRGHTPSPAPTTSTVPLGLLSVACPPCCEQLPFAWPSAVGTAAAALPADAALHDYCTRAGIL
jgi:hypothetical protein